MNDSAHAPHRQLLPVQLFEQIVDSALKPLADSTTDPDSFFESYRLLCVDGPAWSLGNTPTIVAQLPKAASRRLQAAFARVRLVSAVELCTHAPLAAVAAQFPDTERVLEEKLWAKIPERSLIIGDELFGTPRTLLQAGHAMRGRAVSFLTGVRDNIKTQVLEPLPDGSAWVEVPVRERPPDVEPLRIREVRAIGRKLNHKRFGLRLWTTLSDPHRFPAEALARHYAERWKREIHCRELNLDARTTPPARGAHTIETALQEAAALILGSAVLARLRIEAMQRHDASPSRMSFLQLIRATKTLWDTLEMMGHTLTAYQRRHALEHYIKAVQQAVERPERAVRTRSSASSRRTAPAGGRETTQRAKTGQFEIEVLRV